jgi:DNA-binding GntR family transcriptional regulator
MISKNYPASPEASFYGSAEQFVYIHLRNLILSGELKGGTRINPVDVADQLDLSRMPVRDALRQLELEGLVTIMPNRRATVTNLTINEIDELFEMRAVLEGSAARFAASTLTPDIRARLKMLNAAMDEARAYPKIWMQRHADFHDEIVKSSGRYYLASQLRRIRNIIQPYLLMYASVYPNTRADHRRLMVSILSGDASVAEECMLKHVRDTSVGLLKFLRSPKKLRDPREGTLRKRLKQNSRS